jgi:hypothetical protein
MPVKTRDNLGGSCGEGSLADPHSGRLGFPFRRYTEVSIPGLPRSSRHLNSQTSRPPCRSVRIRFPFCINLPLSASNAKNCPQDLQVQFRHRLSTRNGNNRNKSRKLLLSCGEILNQLKFEKQLTCHGTARWNRKEREGTGRKQTMQYAGARFKVESVSRGDEADQGLHPRRYRLEGPRVIGGT